MFSHIFFYPWLSFSFFKFKRTTDEKIRGHLDSRLLYITQPKNAPRSEKLQILQIRAERFLHSKTSI
jgi:hypothetical protein